MGVTMMGDELGDLLEPIVIEWTVDKLDDWVRRLKLNNNLSIHLWQSVRGTLHITQEWAGGIQNATIGLDGDPLGDGTIRLTPYLNEVAQATPAAVAELRYLCSALEATGRVIGDYNGRRHYPPIIINWNRGDVFEWLKWRYVTTYPINPWRSMTSKGEEFIYGLCPYEPCAQNVYLKVEAKSPNQTQITPTITVRNDDSRQRADAEIDNLRRQLEAATATIKPAEVDQAALGIRARQLKVRRHTLIRWERILQEHLQKGLTQAQIAELEDRDIQVIKDDYKRMREKGLLPPLPEKPTLKLTP